MRTILVILLVLVASISLRANDVVWHKGSVVLASREVVVGELARQGLDFLLFRNQSGSITSYPAYKVASFRYYDEKENINRAFIAVAGFSALGKTYRYYERVVYGKISVLRIQKTFNQLIDESDADHPPEGDRAVGVGREYRCLGRREQCSGSPDPEADQAPDPESRRSRFRCGCQWCHPEQSEGPPCFGVPSTEVPRSARDDREGTLWLGWRFRLVTNRHISGTSSPSTRFNGVRLP